jgi:hypothetical protein
MKNEITVINEILNGQIKKLREVGCHPGIIKNLGEQVDHWMTEFDDFDVADRSLAILPVIPFETAGTFWLMDMVNPGGKSEMNFDIIKVMNVYMAETGKPYWMFKVFWDVIEMHEGQAEPKHKGKKTLTLCEALSLAMHTNMLTDDCGIWAAGSIVESKGRCVVAQRKDKLITINASQTLPAGMWALPYSTEQNGFFSD